MSPEIVATYRLTEDVCLDADRALFDHQFRRPLRWAMNALMIFLFALGVAAHATDDVERSALLVARGMMLFAILWLSIPRLRRWRVRRQFRRSPEAGMEITFAFSEDQIRSSSPLVSATSVWALIAGVEEVRSGFLLKFTNRRRIYLPRDAFRPDEIADFLFLVSRKSNSAGKKDLEGEIR